MWRKFLWHCPTHRRPEHGKSSVQEARDGPLAQRSDDDRLAVPREGLALEASRDQASVRRRTM